MTRRTPAALIAVSAAFGFAALASLWVALDPIATGRPLWMLGSALGLASTAVYVIGGGRSLRSAVSASMLGSAFVTCAVLTFLLIGAATEASPYEVLLLVPFALIWVTVPAAIYLVVPATACTVVVFAFAGLIRGLKFVTAVKRFP